MFHREELRAYQLGAIKFIKEKKRCALFVDPGLGKTASSLTALCDLIDDMECGRVLITAPPQVSSKVWHRELLNWMHLKNKSYVIIKGTPKQRRELLKREVCFHIVSMEVLPWLLQELGGDIPRITKVLGGVVFERDGVQMVDLEDGQRPLRDGESVKTPAGELFRFSDEHGLTKSKKSTAEKYEPGDTIKVVGSGWKSPRRIDYDAIIVDESSKVKSQATNRWKALSKLAFLVDYMILLTGTPSANSYEDLWSQIYLLDGGQRLGGTITAFRERWFRPGYDGHGYVVKGWAMKVIENRIADIVFTLREADYSKLPPRMYNYKMLTLDEPTMKRYKHFERKYVLEMVNGKKITARDGAAVTMKLLQLANGVVYNEEGEDGESNRVEYDIHKVKVDALESIADEYFGEPLLVAYEFQSDVTRIQARFKDAKRFDGSEDMQDAWNRREIPMMLVHRKSAAHGLNLQFGGNNIVWYGFTYSLEDYIQLNKRLHRSGQKKPVMIHHLVAEGTIDEAVLKALQNKNDMQEALLNELKKRVEMYVQ